VRNVLPIGPGCVEGGEVAIMLWVANSCGDDLGRSVRMRGASFSYSESDYDKVKILTLMGRLAVALVDTLFDISRDVFTTVSSNGRFLPLTCSFSTSILICFSSEFFREGRAD